MKPLIIALNQGLRVLIQSVESEISGLRAAVPAGAAEPALPGRRRSGPLGGGAAKDAKRQAWGHYF